MNKNSDTANACTTGRIYDGNGLPLRRALRFRGSLEDVHIISTFRVIPRRISIVDVDDLKKKSMSHDR
jgi:hypothetical protein